jgi:hypothetical protein
MMDAKKQRSIACSTPQLALSKESSERVRGAAPFLRATHGWRGWKEKKAALLAQEGQ